MLTEGRKLLGFMKQYFGANLQSAMEYRGAFISQVVFMFINNVMLLFFWWVLFSKIDSLNGWSFSHILLLYAFVSGSYAAQALLFGGSFTISTAIADGRLDFYLTTPKPILLHLVISRSSAPAWGDALFALLIYALAAKPSLVGMVVFVILCFGGGLVMTSFAVITHSLSFWLGHSANLAGQLYEALLSLSMYPEGIFNLSTRVVLYTLIPAGFVSYLPVKIVQGANLGMVALLMSFILAITALARLVFYRGLRRYESGNLVVTNT